MDFAFSQDQESVRQLAAKVIGGLASSKDLKEAEDAGFFHRRLWGELAGAGLLGLALPVEQGGAGMGLVELCLLLEQQGRYAAPVPLLPTLLLGALPVARFGGGEQRARLLPAVAAGDLVLTAALDEIGGDDPAHPATRAERDGDGFRLHGEKVAVVASQLAGRVLVPARLDAGVVVLLVDPAAAGITRQRQVLTGGEVAERLTFDGARIERTDLLGDPGGGAAIVEWLVERATVGLCALALGVAQRQLEMTAEYTTRRQQFERPIASFQAVGQRAADAFIDVAAIRLTLWQAAWRLDAELPAAREVAVAKFWACEGGQRVAATAQHLHGGMGFDRGYPLGRYFLLARRIDLALGAAPQQLERLGALLADPAAPGEEGA
jgi:3-oxocholest-4-en-26-oyl-CoA dehydrogenase beta subunit